MSIPWKKIFFFYPQENVKSRASLENALSFSHFYYISEKTSFFFNFSPISEKTFRQIVLFGNLV